MKYENLPPFAPILMESTRAIGYSIETAVADIIDNSIAAGSSKVDIDFFPIGEPYISILDNGIGMSESELISAMQYGSKSPLDKRLVSDLGRYGLGMKTASLSQCRILTVITKRNNCVVGAQWNLDHINNTKDWSLIVLEQEECANYPNYNKLVKNKSGTIVIWQDLDKVLNGESDIETAFNNKLNSVRSHLSLVFHRYLSGEPGIKKLEIKMNNNEVIPVDPFLSKRSQQLIDDEIILIHGEKIRVRPFILPHTSRLSKDELESLGGKDGLRAGQGFYVYRNKRLLIWGTWFRLMRKGDLSKLARVQVDIPNSLDDLWTLDIKKSTAIPPEEVRKNLSTTIDKISEGSKRTWVYRGKKEISDDSITYWNRLIDRDKGISYEINLEHPLLKNIIETYPEISKKLLYFVKQISISLPLNSLYVDLTSDQKVLNEDDQNEVEIINSLKEIALCYPAGDDRDNIIQILKTTNPYKNYQEEISIALDRGEFND